MAGALSNHPLRAVFVSLKVGYEKFWLIRRKSHADCPSFKVCMTQVWHFYLVLLRRFLICFSSSAGKGHLADTSGWFHSGGIEKMKHLNQPAGFLVLKKENNGEIKRK